MSERAADDPVWIAGPDATGDEAADAAVAKFLGDLGL